MHMDILSEKDRRALCDFIFEKATDEDILGVVKQTKERFLYVQDELTDIKKFVGSGRFSDQPKTSAPVKTPVKAEPEPEKVEVSAVPNVEPAGTPAKRVGGNTKQTIVRLLESKPLTSAKINAGLNGVQTNTDAVLKLLWTRKELKFNGQEFYL